MAAWKLLRVVLAVSVVAGMLIAHASVSVAQDPTVSLVEEVAPHEVGDNAQVRLNDVSAFETAGGKAIIEPGTSNAETFSYDRVDDATDRLIGLSRSEPAAHPVGAVVEPAMTTAAEPVAAADEDPESGSAPAESEGDPQSSAMDEEGAPAPPASAGDETPTEASSSTAADSNVIDAVIDVIAGVVGDPCAGETTGSAADVGDPWSRLDLGDLDVCAMLDDIETGNPCDPNDTGQTCEQYVDGWINDLWSQCQAITDCDAYVDSVCDPEDTAQTCEDWLLGIPKADPGGCGLVPGNVVSGEAYVEGYGTITCTKKQKKIKVLVCVERRIDGEWVTLEEGCDLKKKLDASEVMGHAKSICAPGTHKYRIWMSGTAVHYSGGKFFGVDSGPDDPITCYPGVGP